MRLIEEKDRVNLVSAEIVPVRLDREEQVGCGGGGVQAEGVAEIAVEVAAAERGVAAVRQTEAGLRQLVAKRPKDARLADAGLAHQQDALSVCERILDVG